MKYEEIEQSPQSDAAEAVEEGYVRQGQRTAAVAGLGSISTPMLSGSANLDIHGTNWPGRLVVLEGTDNVGRSTQIALLREWLEAHGFGVAHTALGRGRLAADGLNKAKQGHTLGRLTMDLFYATDFADRLEHFILPALRAGFVVLTDRYVFSAMARAIVRGVEPAWIADVYQFAPRPHAIFYLKATVEKLVPRVLNGEGFDYWESGMDFQEETDIFQSFVRYQTRLLAVMEDLAVQHSMRIIDADGSVSDTFRALKPAMLEVVSGMKGARL